MANASEGWSRTSAAYSQKIVEVTSQGGQALLQLVEPLKPFDDSARVLDIGAGSGALTSLLRGKCAGMDLVAADVAPGMLEQLKKRQLQGVDTIVVDAAKDYVAQGLKEEDFTHVLSTFMLQFISPVQTAFSETFRVLKPGGVIGSAIWSKNDVAEPWNIACKNLDPTFEPNTSYFAKAVKTVDDLEAAYAAAGFEDVRSSEAELFLQFESAEAFTDYFIFTKHPPFLMAMNTWEGKPEDVRDEMVRVTREQFEDGKIYMVAACSVGRKPLQ